MAKTKVGLLLMLVFLAIAATGCGTTGADADAGDEAWPKLELSMSVNGTDIQIDTKVADKFAELVAEETGGRITIVVFPNDQLAGGNATKGIEMIALGSVDLAAYATSTLSVIDRQLSIGTIPWSFEDYTDARQTIDSIGANYYTERLAAKGLTYLGSFHNGFRQLTNSKRAVKTPEDIKGLKIRVPGSEIYMGVFRTLGADPVSMSWSEVFTAIQQGTIDGQENGVSISASAKMPEIQKHITLWNYAYDSDLIIANSKVWDALDENVQTLLSEKAKEACEWGRDKLEADEADLLAQFEEQGMEITYISKEEQLAFKQAVNSFRNQMIDSYGEDACANFGIKKEGE